MGLSCISNPLFQKGIETDARVEMFNGNNINYVSAVRILYRFLCAKCIRWTHIGKVTSVRKPIFAKLTPKLFNEFRLNWILEFVLKA